VAPTPSRPPFFSVYIYERSSIYLLYSYDSYQERINNPRKFISRNRQQQNSSVQIKENFHHSSLYFRSMNSHSRLAAFFPTLECTTDRLL
jgi:hypothetical protein